MLKKIALTLTMLATTGVLADGFTCKTTDGKLNVKVYDNTEASKGTRTAAVMTLSDTTVKKGRKTIAKFTDVENTLTNKGASYVANVDLRFSNIKRKGENLLGTKLGELKTIQVEVAFTYAKPIKDGKQTTGMITAHKRNGGTIVEDLTCKRYLKN